MDQIDDVIIPENWDNGNLGLMSPVGDWQLVWFFNIFVQWRQKYKVNTIYAVIQK